MKAEKKNHRIKRELLQDVFIRILKKLEMIFSNFISLVIIHFFVSILRVWI
jgi:hypothetical protein